MSSERVTVTIPSEVLAEARSAVREVVDVPVIASGGAGTVADFPPAVAAGADAVLAASVFHFGELRIGEVKDGLRAAGVTVRLTEVAPRR